MILQKLTAAAAVLKEEPKQSGYLGGRQSCIVNSTYNCIINILY